MFFRSVSKQVKITLLLFVYSLYLLKDRGSDQKRKGRIKYEMRVFVRGFNGRRRLIKHKTEIIIR